MQTAGQRHTMELRVALRNFAKAPKNGGEIVNGKINITD